ncbi:glycosyl hydrolase 115 family protein [Saccharibacillus sacchari]|uniref:Glycosyl hydrolase 115 family protein n=1 Tax=Saccharibacillus sacchari TaxID=456493 RepID=A0ACC6PE60_9BACL
MSETNPRKACVSGYVSTVSGTYTLASPSHIPVIYTDMNDYTGVVRAVDDLCQDLKAVTKQIPVNDYEQAEKVDIIIGTIGHSAGVDLLIAEGKLDVTDIEGKWEAFKLVLIENMLVIAGADKRGTIFGIYDLSEKIGVSPWYWWADVVPGYAESLYVTLDQPYVEYEPSVQYRGIFLNDEYALHNWAVDRGDEDYVEMYTRIYELLLRLKANFLWPAMHSYSPHFHKNPLNAQNADRYGIVMGSSHCEMLLKNNQSEYFEFERTWELANPDKRLYKAELSDAPKACAYVYIDAHPETGMPVSNKELIQAYWRDSVETYGGYENVYTLGMRGMHDAKWQPIGANSPQEKVALLEEIIDVQREILAEVLQQDLSQIPQLFIPYKEIQEIYDSGMRVPEDVSLMWTDDNYGYIRQLPTDHERERTGGAGIYYHLSYHGYPNSYIWLSTTPLALIREEMGKAYGNGARKVWVANVGDLKPAENQIEYFLNLAREVHTVYDRNLNEYMADKAARDFGFGATDAQEYAEIQLGFHQMAFAKKPEYFGADNFNFEGYGLTPQQFQEACAQKPKFVLADLFNYKEFGDEGQQYVDRYRRLVERSEKLYLQLDPKLQPAFYQLQLYPLRSSYHVACKYVYAVKSKLYFDQGRGTVANKYAERSDDFYYELVKDTKTYNALCSRKWNRIMDPYQTFFRSCGAVLPKLLETSKDTGHPELGAAAETLTFSRYTRQQKWIDIYNTGYAPLKWIAETNEDYLILSKVQGAVKNDERIRVGIDWDRAPQGICSSSIQIHHIHDGQIVKSIPISVSISNRSIDLSNHAYVEADGYISIRTDHYTKVTAYNEYVWRTESHLSRTGNSLKAYPDLAKSVETPHAANTSHADYLIYFESTGTFEVDIYRIPTLNERGAVRFAIGLNDKSPTIVHGTNAYTGQANPEDNWSKGVLENNETLTARILVSEKGYQTLRLYRMDSGVILDKIVIWTGERIPSYFGPPESYHSAYPNIL